MPWSRIDKNDLLIAAPTRQQVASETRMFEDRFQRCGAIAWSDVAQEFYQWMVRRTTRVLREGGRGRPKMLIDLSVAAQLRRDGLSWGSIAKEIGVSFTAIYSRRQQIIEYLPEEGTNGTEQLS